MQLLSGAMSVVNLQRLEVSALNTGVVTVVAGGTEVVSIDCQTVGEGDRIFINIGLRAVKGAGAGATRFNCQKKSGTATIVMLEEKATAEFGWDVGNGETTYYCFSIMVRVTASGTLVLQSMGYSAVADSTIAARAANIYAWIVRGST